MQSLRRLSTLLAVMVLIYGCGGGAKNGANVSTTAPVRFSIEWAERGRAVSGPGSALSAVLTLDNADPAGHDFTFTINRDAAPARYTATYTTPNQSRIGDWQFTLRFYAQADGGGAVVGVAQSDANVLPGATNIGVIVTARTIKSLDVPLDQVVLVGDTKDLAFTARDANGAIVAVTPGSAILTNSNPAVLQLVNGQLKGIAPGTSNVTAFVDSAGASVNVQVREGDTPEFTVVELPALGFDDTVASGLNNRGDVVGRARDLSGNDIPFLWKNGIMTALPVLPGDSPKLSRRDDAAHDINDAGVIVGNSGVHTAAGNTRLVLWQNGNVTAIAETTAFQNDVRHRLHGARINKEGKVLFKTEDTTGQASAGIFLWQSGATSTIKLAAGPSGNEMAIDDQGNVAFTALVPSTNAGSTNAFLWRAGTITQLEGPSPSLIIGMNSSGQVVGATASNDMSGLSATVWTNGVRTALPLPPGYGPQFQSWANAINNHGDAVGVVYNGGNDMSIGATPILWHKGVALDIRNLIPRDSIRGFVVEAVNINDAGQILVVAGSSLNTFGSNGGTRSYLLTPK